ncbi:hypothetical protein V6N13_102531 [Hibiscus sabdariffa]|uniref:Uncharacterized protein n=1 Tax=Hibiscus sabdariffa TaxID=183260 RepID=A0ABR2D4B3_9ROSI
MHFNLMNNNMIYVEGSLLSELLSAYIFGPIRLLVQKTNQFTFQENTYLLAAADSEIFLAVADSEIFFRMDNNDRGHALGLDCTMYPLCQQMSQWLAALRGW